MRNRVWPRETNSLPARTTRTRPGDMSTSKHRSWQLLIEPSVGEKRQSKHDDVLVIREKQDELLVSKLKEALKKRLSRSEMGRYNLLS